MEGTQSVPELFEAAVALAPDDRSSFLARACGDDPSLLGQLRSLLAADARAEAGKFLDSSAIEVEAHLTAAAETDARIGELFGPYKILELIGVGGMGAIYLAERADHEYKRKVAIKLIKRGMDTDFILRRFRNERQILANLNHPNIAQLLNGGTTDDGLPYFAMEYVEGLPIDKYCDAKKLNTAQRLELFRQVCGAVQYAHQNLVVHRDLKPTNMLVTAEGNPKLLDFGIAKVLDSQPGEIQDATVTSLRVMTPEYASPEQVKGEPITTASDVYSLGVVLYELLTGQRPYKLKNARPDALAKAICEQEPARPSTSASSPGSQVPDLKPLISDPKSKLEAAGSQPKSLSRDLDKIVLMALRKEPQRRYASVDQFSEDIRRYLARRPVIARKDTLSYRTSRFIRRNRLGVSAAALILLTLIGGIITTAWQARVARRERARAEQRFNDVRQMSNTFMFELNDEVEREPTRARELLVRHALEYLDSLARESGNDPSLQRELATAYQRLGDVQSRLHGQNLGTTGAALESYRKALAIRQSLFAAKPEEERSSLDLADSYNRMSDVLSKTNNTAGALENYRSALRLVEQLLERNPAHMQARKDLGYGYLTVGRAQLKLGALPEALASFQKSEAIRELLAKEHVGDASLRLDLIPAYDGVAYILSLNGKPKEALDYYRKSLVVARELTANDPQEARARRALMDTLEWIGITLGEIGEDAAALDNHKQALALCELALTADPANAQAHNDIGDVYSEIGNTLVRLGKARAALRNFAQSISNYEAVSKADPEDKNARRQVYATYRQMGDAFALLGDRNSALENYHKALAVFKELSTADPANAETQADVAISYHKIAKVLERAGDHSGAIENLRPALSIFEMLAERSPTNAKLAKDLAFIYLDLGHATANAGTINDSGGHRTALRLEAQSWYQKSLDVWQDLRTKGVLSGAASRKPEEVEREITKLAGRAQ